MKHNWKHIKFGDAFNLQMGKTPARANSAYWSNGLYDWVSISDMPNGKYIQGTKEKISQKAVDDTGIHLVKKGTALMSFKLTIGKTAITPYDLYTNEAIMAFEPKDGTDVLADFLYYYLQLYEWDGNRAVMGNTTNKGVISNSYAYIPSLDEQQAIVRELDGINRLIDLQEEQLREYDRLAQSLFYTTFGDPATNPKGWEVKKLGEVAVIRDGSHNPPKGVDMPTAYRMLSSQNIFDNLIDYSKGVRYLSKESFDLEHKRTNLKAGDVLLTIVGTIGRVCLVTDKDTNITLQRSVAVLSPKDKILSIYLNRLLSVIGEKLKYESRGVAQKGIYLGQLSKTLIPLPPLALQQSFAAQIEAIEQQKALVHRSLDETRTLLAARMQYYFE